jgi:hypothetical protein
MIPSSAATSPALVTGVELFFAAVYFHLSPESSFPPKNVRAGTRCGRFFGGLEIS